MPLRSIGRMGTVVNLPDDSLALDRRTSQELPPAMVNRFTDLMAYAGSIGVQGALFACSALGTLPNGSDSLSSGFSSASLVSLRTWVRTVSDMAHEIITSVERRRKWPDEEKLRIMSEALVPDATASAVANRNGVCRSLLYTWLRLAREGRLPEAPAGDC